MRDALLQAAEASGVVEGLAGRVSLQLRRAFAVLAAAASRGLQRWYERVVSRSRYGSLPVRVCGRWRGDQPRSAEISRDSTGCRCGRCSQRGCSARRWRSNYESESGASLKWRTGRMKHNEVE